MDPNRPDAPAPVTTDHRDDPARVGVVVVGAGQAGLAVGQQLAARGADLVLLEAASEVGASWRRRWDSLRLFSPAQHDSLPGMPFPAPADTHPTKDEVADYLAAYAERFDLPVRLDTPVRRLVRDDDGSYLVSTPDGVLRADVVVVATGPFQQPSVPAVAAQLDPGVPQLHTADYRNPGQVVGGRVLVVGGGNSGLQVAEELSTTCSVTLAVGSRALELPQRIAGRDLFDWLTRFGFFGLRSDHPLARRLRTRGDLVIGTRTSTLRRHGVDVRPRLVGFAGDVARFADGTTTTVDAVVWATGFRSDHSWVQVPGVVVDGDVQQRHGVTDAPGLYFLGLPWQTSRGSALLGYVGADASVLADRIAREASEALAPAR